MKLKAFFLMIILVLPHTFVVAKINDPRIWTNFYESCYAEYRAESQMSKKEFSKYCTCAADQVTEKMTVKEVALLELDMMQERSKEEQVKIALTSKKFKDIIAECISKIFN